MGSVVVVCIKAMARAACLALAGTLLAKRGLVTPASVTVLSGLTTNVLLPSLLLTRVAASIVLEDGVAWLYLATLELLYFGVGFTLGWLAQHQFPERIRGAMRVSVWNNNSSGLPIVITTTLAQSNVAGVEEADAVKLIGLYAIVYHMIAWSTAPVFLHPTSPFVPLAAAEYDPNPEHDHGHDQQPEELVEVLAERDDQRLVQGERSDEVVGPSTAATLPLPPSPPPPPAASARAGGVAALLRSMATPPLIAVVTGVVLGLMPFKQNLLLDRDAPLNAVWTSLQMLGTACVPLNLIILGVSLSDGPRLRLATPKALLIASFFRLVAVPAVGLTAAACVHRHCAATSHCPARLTQTVVLVVGMVQSLTPTANNMVMMCTAYCKDAEVVREMAAVIFWQSLMALFTITTWLSVLMIVLDVS